MPADKDARAGKSAAATREERLEAQLRANLKRRKDQTRARAKPEAGSEHPEEVDAPPDLADGRSRTGD